MMDGFSRAIPASVVCVSSIGSCINFGLTSCLNFFIFQTLLNLEKLLRSRLIGRMSRCTNGIVPSGALSTEEVAIDGMLDVSDGGLSALMIWVGVLIPSVEASLVSSVVQLTVMN